MVGKLQIGATVSSDGVVLGRPPFSPTEPRHSRTTTVRAKYGDTGSATFRFEHPTKRTAYAHRLTAEQRERFAARVCDELSQLVAWFRGANWPISVPENLHISISDRHVISKSLVPAWFGQEGRMEFPSWRVVAERAAITHELVHVLAPNSNRLLAEGLAIHLQAELGGNPAFPNFDKPLHEQAYEVLRTIVPSFRADEPASCRGVDLELLDSIPVPNPLVLRIGQTFYDESPYGQARIYPLAGSFVRFLIEARGIERFRDLYQTTPLTPLICNSGSPERWDHIYGCPLAELDVQWKRMLLCSFE